ncbi:MAG: hypothetical protein CL840_13040 [Crocinitomicaceae bacterium]|nr:hypothetical protein [Crocinitomicaceae bacterium]|tara:strand:- start:22899 stop:24032 length:1134 start_codon:yes stop_codon:yes gene_type:complete
MLEVNKIIKEKLWISSVSAIVLCFVAIPLLLVVLNPVSDEIIEGVYVKSGNRIFVNFLNRIKSENGILVLGTSETGNELNGNNYFDLLNRDAEINRPVYALGGAGRLANVYFPLIIDNPDAFKDLNVLYYINPTYWRFWLNNFNEDYFNRYIDSSVVYRIKDRAIQLGVYKEFMYHANFQKGTLKIKANSLVDDFRSFYYYDLLNLIENIEKHEKAFPKEQCLVPFLQQPNKSQEYSPIYDSLAVIALKGKINPIYNCLDNFLESKTPFPMIDTTSNYQDNLLKVFISLTKEYDINCVFYLGPYNRIYGSQKNPEVLVEYERVVDRIKLLLDQNKVPYIDGTELSDLSGTFMDVQHISEYGAYLTALQIKGYYVQNK